MKKNKVIVLILGACVIFGIIDGEYLFAVEKNGATDPARSKSSVVSDVLNSLERAQNSSAPKSPESINQPTGLNSNSTDSFFQGTEENLKVPQEKDSEEVSQFSSKQEPVVIPTLDLQNVSIQEALDILEEKSGLVIIPEEDTKPFLSKHISLYLEDIDVWDVLKIILEPHDLAFAEEKNIVRVMTADDFVRRYQHVFAEKIKTRIIPVHYRDDKKLAESLMNLKSPEGKIFVDDKAKAIIVIGTLDDLTKIGKFIQECDIPLQTKVFTLEHVTVKDIKDRVEKILTKDIGQLEYDLNANKMILTDTVDKLQQVQSFVQQLDKPMEVSLGSQIIQIQLSEEKIKGIDWEAIVSQYRNLDADQPSPPKDTRALSAGIISKEDYLVLLEALETVGQVDVVSSPSTIIANRKDVYLQLRSNDTGTTVTMTTSPTKKDVAGQRIISLKEVDREFYVTPQIRSGTPMTVAIVSVNRAQTSKVELEVQDGDVIVLGGVFRDQQVSQMKKFPFLGDLPFLGMAFRKQGTKMIRMEYVIFLMPKILESDK